MHGLLGAKFATEDFDGAVGYDLTCAEIQMYFENHAY